MSGHGFTSAFATELDAYLAFKANMGFTGAPLAWGVIGWVTVIR